jgi:hypothetical protein
MKSKINSKRWLPITLGAAWRDTQRHQKIAWVSEDRARPGARQSPAFISTNARAGHIEDG